VRERNDVLLTPPYGLLVMTARHKLDPICASAHIGMAGLLSHPTLADRWHRSRLTLFSFAFSEGGRTRYLTDFRLADHHAPYVRLLVRLHEKISLGGET